MVIQLADKYGYQIKALLDASLDLEVNDGERDFELSVPLSTYDGKIQAGCRIFVEGTEFGGIIGETYTNTALNELTFRGYTWRGLLEKKLILPPDGEDYYVASGYMHNILGELLSECYLDSLFKIGAGVTAMISSHQFERFCTLRAGIEKLFKNVGCRMNISYNVGQPNERGWVEISAVPIVDYSDQIELSQDSQLNFRMTDKRNGVNHLVVGGKGELQERNILHLYVQEDGTIGDTQYYYGADEVVAFYENTSTETEDLMSASIEQLEKLMNKKTFEMDVETLDIDVAVGDIVGGRDYITGMYMKKPLENIVVKISNGTIQKEYKLEGTES